MRILIVDDEVVERTALRKLINKYYKKEIDCIESAINGEQAIEFTRKFNPDIIFMDIKMPRMDGIEASLKIREFNKNVKIIIVTAFSDFSFAKQAITCNVSDYLVKPYSIKTLKNTVDKVIEELDIIKQKTIEKLNLQQSIATEFLNKMLERNNLSDEELENFLQSLNIRDKNYCFIITKGELELPFCEATFFSKSIFSYTIYLFSKIEIDFYDKLLCSNLILSKSEIVENSSIIESIFASTLNRLAFILEQESTQSFELQLFNEIVNCDYYKINVLSNEIVEIFYLKYGFGNIFFKNIYELLIKEIQLLYNLNEADSKLYAEKFEQKESQLKQNNFASYKKEFPNLLIDLCNLYHKNRKSSQEKLVENTIKYLKDNYKDNIGMDNISEEMFVSKSYLSRVFSKFKGCTVMEYLLKIRIDEAKKLLIEGNSIAFTSIEVGFSNPAYFSKNFKKETGTSPSQFIENN